MDLHEAHSNFGNNSVRDLPQDREFLLALCSFPQAEGMRNQSISKPGGNLKIVPTTTHNENKNNGGVDHFLGVFCVPSTVPRAFQTLVSFSLYRYYY